MHSVYFTLFRQVTGFTNITQSHGTDKLIGKKSLCNNAKIRNKRKKTFIPKQWYLQDQNSGINALWMIMKGPYWPTKNHNVLGTALTPTMIYSSAKWNPSKLKSSSRPGGGKCARMQQTEHEGRGTRISLPRNPQHHLTRFL